MGLFSKLKNNFKHGGVKLSMQAPATARLTDTTLPVVVNLTASDQAQTINRVSAEIIATSRNQTFSTGGNQTTPTTQQHTVARVDNNETFSLAPGETKSVQLNLTMNGGAQALGTLTGMDPNSKAGEIAGKVIGALGAGNSAAYSYRLKASADVADVTFDPAAEQDLQILAPGEIGGNFRINV